MPQAGVSSLSALLTAVILAPSSNHLRTLSLARTHCSFGWRESG
jgi:hypothetical protein